MQRRIPLSPIPKTGDSKSSLHFAFLPHVIGNTRVWMERYEVLYIWQESKITGIVEGKAAEFTVGEWVKVSERVINGKHE
jgi:hypothetical protein